MAHGAHLQQAAQGGARGDRHAGHDVGQTLGFLVGDGAQTHLVVVADLTGPMASANACWRRISSQALTVSMSAPMRRTENSCPRNRVLNSKSCWDEPSVTVTTFSCTAPRYVFSLSPVAPGPGLRPRALSGMGVSGFLARPGGLAHRLAFSGRSRGGGQHLGSGLPQHLPGSCSAARVARGASWQAARARAGCRTPSARPAWWECPGRG